jgi:hypothetical protein
MPTCATNWARQARTALNGFQWPKPDKVKFLRALTRRSVKPCQNGRDPEHSDVQGGGKGCAFFIKKRPHA